MDISTAQGLIERHGPGIRDDVYITCPYCGGCNHESEFERETVGEVADMAEELTR